MTTTANNARKPWPPEHDEYLRTHINKHSYLTLGLALGRSALSVKQRCHLIGVKRTVDLRKAATVNPTTLAHGQTSPNAPRHRRPTTAQRCSTPATPTTWPPVAPASAR